MSTREFDINDDNPDFNRIKTYKPNPQICEAFGPDRISFLSWPDLQNPNFGLAHLQNKNPRFVGGRRIYLKGIHYVSPRFSADPAKKAEEENELIGYFLADGKEDGKVNDPMKAIQSKAATLIVVWPKAGTTKGPEVFPWIMPPSTFEEIKTKNNKAPLWCNDIEVTPKAKGTWVDLKLEMGGSSLLLELVKKKEAGDAAATSLLNVILAKARELQPVLANEIGKDLTMADIRQRRGLGGGTSSAKTSEIAQVVTSDVQSLVQDLIAD